MSTNSNLLVNAPLKEVIFVLNWELDFILQQNAFIDTGFDEALLSFTSNCQPEFNTFEILVPSGFPPSLLTKQVTHRFYKEEKKHPLYQFGPGIFTTNDNNKNYSWVEFKKLVLLGIEKLRNSYKKTLIPTNIELRYIDAVNLSVLGDKNKFDFLRRHLNVNAEKYDFVDGELIDINFTKRFLINEETYLTIILATGKDTTTDEENIVWHTLINSRGNISWEKLDNWIENAHSICSNTFKKMVNQ